MGVRGLWDVVGPVAKPVQLEALRGQRLAVDASIWIYHFLKAVRDQEGNVVRYAHLVGFFRRICKLLFFGIKPVFVFDGGAPALKRMTIKRRQDRRNMFELNAQRTAARLLALQLERKRHSKPKVATAKSESITSKSQSSAVYYDERLKPEAERTEINGEKPFRPSDQYDLPEMDNSRSFDGSDPRLMSEDEIAAYAREFQSSMSAGIGLYDTDKVNYESEEFKSLPLATQYQILNTARLKSRLRLGLTAEQLDAKFPDSLEFSRFQVKRVAQRNYLTQSIMNLVGMNEEGSRRVAGEKGREYILSKNDSSGWTLALEGNKVHGKVVDETQLHADEEAIEKEVAGNDNDDDWEEVDIAGPKKRVKLDNAQEEGDLDLASSELISEQQVLLDELFEEKQKLDQVAKDIAQRARLEPPDTSTENYSMPTFSMAKKTSQPGTLPVPLFLSSSLLDDSAKTILVPKEMGKGAVGVLGAKVGGHLGDSSLFGTSSLEHASNDHARKTTEDKSDRTEKPQRPLEVKSDSTEELEEPFKEKSDSTENPNQPPWFTENSTLKVTAGIRDMKASDEIVPLDRVEELQRLRDGDDEAGEDDDFDDVPLDIAEMDPRVDEKYEKEGKSEKEEVYEISEGEPVHESIVQVRAPEVVSPLIVTSDDSEANHAPDPVELNLAELDVKFEQEEDEDLMEQFEQELQENERFTKALNSGLLQLRSQQGLEDEARRLRVQRQREKRDADMVSDDMVAECQQLLQRFGIPYITAPMEAEAQCAKLMDLGLVDGIVTDDSDCFLFGGRKVYKNMFNQAKWVECYDLDDVRDTLSLDRERLVSLAMLLGSDYTDGLTGVGPVTAMELLAEFNPKESGGNDQSTYDEGSDPLAPLINFRDWWNGVQGFKSRQDFSTPFKRKFKKNLTKLYLAEGFPDRHVHDAYINPTVDHDTTPFQWGTPDLDELRIFLESSTGWSRERIDEMLVPVLRNMSQPKQAKPRFLQTTIEAQPPPMKRLELGSKRMFNALEKLKR